MLEFSILKFLILFGQLMRDTIPNELYAGNFSRLLMLGEIHLIIVQNLFLKFSHLIRTRSSYILTYYPRHTTNEIVLPKQFNKNRWDSINSFPIAFMQGFY